jgi:hypothetical protein
LAQEHGHVTYDDINDVLPDGLTPNDLDELYTKLRNFDVEIVDHARWSAPSRAEPEEEEDTRLEVLDDPVRMYMNQMGKVPLLTREQEVEICKRIEEAESDIKRLVYGLGFTAKEHIAIAEKLLSEPPKERLTGWWWTRRWPTAKPISGNCGPDQEGPGAGCQSGREIHRLAEGQHGGPPPKAPRQVPEAGQEAAGHLPEVLLQAAGPGGHDPGGQQRP